MKTYQAMRAQIAKLEQQAEALRARELKDVIAKIKSAIAAYDLTADDLGLAGKAAKAPKVARRGKAKGKSASRGRATVGVAKYRDPKTGDTWTGRGRPPTWIVASKNRDAFLIDAPNAPAAKPATKNKAAAKPRAAAKRAKAVAAKKKVSGKRAKAKSAINAPAVQIESGAASQ
jgi:DNA-binding protein H-NS